MLKTNEVDSVSLLIQISEYTAPVTSLNILDISKVKENNEQTFFLVNYAKAKMFQAQVL